MLQINPTGKRHFMKIAVLDDYQRVAADLADWKRLDGCTVDFLHDRIVGDAEIVARLTGYDAIVIMRERTEISRGVIENLPHLRLIATSGSVNRAIDMDAARAKGITVVGTGWAEDATVQLAWALLLGLANNTKQEDASLRAGKWQSTIGVSLIGKTLGVLGLGSIGSKVALVGQAFGMRVIAYSQNLTAEKAAKIGVEAVTKQRLLTDSDFLSVHVRLSERTVGMIGAAELALMKKTAYLVNTARAPIVSEVDLAAALHNGTIAGAGIDVFNVEPIEADNPLLGAPNTLLTPHIGYVTHEVYSTWFEEVIQDIEAYRRGEPIRVVS